MQTISLAVVGPGLIGSKHIRLVQANPACRLAAIVAPDNAHNYPKAEAAGVPLYHTIAQMLEKERVDGIIISSPSNFHVEQALTCVDAGIPVLLEKPIATSYQDGLRLLQRVEEKKAKLIVGHHRVHNAIMKTAAQIIRSGQLGELVTVTGAALLCKPADYFEKGPWRKELGGGPILINLIHDIGNYRMLCGEIASVQAIASNKRRGFPVEDTVVINFEFVNGALGTFVLSDTAASCASWEHASGENPDFPYYPNEDCYTVSGTRGSLSIPSMRIHKFAEGTEPSWLRRMEEQTVTFEKKDPLATQLEHFVNVIRGTEAPIVTAYEGLQNVKVIEAIRQSISNHAVVKV